MNEFQQDEIPVKVTGLSIKFGILVAAVVPMVVLAAVLIIYATTSMKSSLREEAEEGLKYSVNAMAAAYEAISAKDYMLQEKGGEFTLYKGGFNVCANQTFIDAFTGDTDLELSVFYGDTRYATSLTDESGKRIMYTQAAPEIVDAVINRGEEFSTNKLDINGTNYYAHYIPIRNSDDTIVGMYFAGKPADFPSIFCAFFFGQGPAVYPGKQHGGNSVFKLGHRLANKV